MLSAQNVELGELRFGGAEQVAIGATDEKDNSGGNNNPTTETRPVMNRHAAILAGASSERQPVARLDAMRASELRQRMLSVVDNYLNSKTGKVEPRHIECELGERELARLDAAVSAPVCSGGNEPWTGRQRFILSFSTAAGPVQVPIFADVAPPPVPAVFAVRPIARGDVIKAADIELRKIDPAAKTPGQRVAADSVDKLIGMEARQSIQAGDMLLADQVQSPILVKRGDLITVTSQCGGIRVRTSARALHDGAHGDLVQVESLESREKYDARIVGPREAAVFAMSRPVTPEPQRRVDTARR